MALIFKAAAAALTAALIALLIRQKNPEIALLMSIATVTLILTAVVGMSDGLLRLRKAVAALTENDTSFSVPIIKCTAVAIVTKITGDLCRDSSQSAAASAVDLAGTFCALSIVMPLILSMLELAGDML